MAIDTRDPIIRTFATPHRITTTGSRGLLLTESPALARAFRRELKNCDSCSTAFDVHSALDEAIVSGARYRWIAIDLDATLAPSEAMRQARATWPDARLAALSCWWSERDVIARETADTVLHKPIRSTELLTFLKASADGVGVAPPSRAV
jgi:hypothetical protein